MYTDVCIIRPYTTVNAGASLQQRAQLASTMELHAHQQVSPQLQQQIGLMSQKTEHDLRRELQQKKRRNPLPESESQNVGFNLHAMDAQRRMVAMAAAAAAVGAGGGQNAHMMMGHLHQMPIPGQLSSQQQVQFMMQQHMMQLQRRLQQQQQQQQQQIPRMMHRPNQVVNHNAAFGQKKNVPPKRDGGDDGGDDAQVEFNIVVPRDEDVPVCVCVHVLKTCLWW
jgi:hypothetical protein